MNTPEDDLTEHYLETDGVPRVSMPEDSLLREAFEHVAWCRGERPTAPSTRLGSDIIEALATRLSAAHQPAVPAWGMSRETLEAMCAAFVNRTRNAQSWDRWVEEDKQSVRLNMKAALAALPPPAPTLDPEAVARVIWDTTRWSPEMPSFAHEYPWDREWPAGHEGLRELILQQAAAVIAMAPPAGWKHQDPRKEAYKEKKE